MSTVASQLISDLSLESYICKFGLEPPNKGHLYRGILTVYIGCVR